MDNKENMSKFVFQVSKFNANKNRLRCKERFNKAKDTVTAMATLYMDAHHYISGMHYAFQDDEGDVTYSFDKNESAKDIKIDVTINFKSEQLVQLQQQIAEAGTSLTKPPSDENGVSELMGWQLHVIIKHGEEITFTQERDERWGDKLIYKIQPHQVKGVKLVTAGDEAYIEAPNSAKIDLGLAMKALYTPREPATILNKPNTVEEAQSTLLDFSKAKSRGERRKEKRQSKQVEQAAIALSEVVIPQTPVQEVVQSTNQQIVLVDDDEEDDKPE